MTILTGPRHVNLWPAIGSPKQPIVNRVSKATLAKMIASATTLHEEVERASCLGVFIFIKLDNGQEFEAHVIERTPRR